MSENITLFEYLTIEGKRATINPKMISCIIERDSDSCIIYFNDSDPLIIKTPYCDMRDQFNHFMYTIQTIVSVR